MKHLFLVLVCSIIVAVSTQAQTTKSKYLITGQAIDSVSGQTIPYVTCSVVEAKNPKVVIARFAGDGNGVFTGNLKAPGKYTIVISFVGEAPAQRTFTLTPAHPVVDFGKVAMSDNKHLKEVVVVATKPLIKADVDKISYDVQQDPEAKASTALDMLRKVPMVTVDGQDNIQLQGSSNFKIYLNGKPSNLFSNNPSQVLKSFPASMIKNIEVITQPGAKYDAEGVGGIINIVTYQHANTNGYSVTVNGQVSSRKSYGGGVNLAFQSGKFSFSGNYNYSYFMQPHVTTTSTRDVLPINGVIVGYAHAGQVATVNNQTPAQFGSGQLSYSLDSLNLFSLSFDRQYGRQQSSTIAQTIDQDANYSTVFGYDQNSLQHSTWGSTDFGLDYQHTFRKKGENLTASYKFSNTPNNSDYTATNDNLMSLVMPQAGLAKTSSSVNSAYTHENTFQVDFSDPLNKFQTLDMGAKFIRRNNTSYTTDHNIFYVYSSNPPTLTPDSIDHTSFNQNQSILAGYISYSANWKKFGMKIGARYEYTWQNGFFNNIDTLSNFDTNYGVLVPSGAITYTLAPMQTLRLGYNMRIQRPGISFLNPYVNRRDPNYINYGNPSLDPEKSNNITFGYSNFSPTYNISAELSYTFVNNAIEQYSGLLPNSSVQYSTYGNIGHNNQLFLNLFGSYRGLRWLNIYMNGNIEHVNMKSSDQSMQNSGYTGHVFLGGTFMFPADYRLSVGGGANLPQVNLQGSQSSFLFSYMALSKDLLKKRLTLSLVGIALPKQHIYLNTHATYFNQYTDVHIYPPCELRFNVSYRIGSLNAQVKKPKVTINNNDLKNQNQNQQPGSGVDSTPSI
ncbi:TonB-dependent receptor domain-containing protein [Microbacter margulisiae]|uniref:Outer membrane receptor for ferrienterochelin and colicin n=1 Tax=Microbacter margulisiae TaxID=1350067 RepID=A0A7W5DNS9_9PORP|nr:TonB-dependent receptor [Microbacter margulisiae]MBB3186166.1 outer membrane receptor for ferrienterochelin and colicin [Microbacter margulisiae]